MTKKSKSRFKYPFQYCCIITSQLNTWYCKTCKKAHNKLYVNNKNEIKYCPTCVPDTIKNKSVNIDHNNKEL